MSQGIQQATAQWRSRPDDQRFTSLIELGNHVRGIRERSIGKAVASRDITVAPIDGDADGLVATGPNGAPVAFTNWSFGQIAQRAGAPAGYLRELPAPLAADCINYGLKHVRDNESLGVLLHKPADGQPAELRAVTGPNYGRVWNSTIVDGLIKRFGDGVTGDFRVPGEFGVALSAVTKENTTLYASDRDLFVFLADERNRIEIKDRRNGEAGSLARGFYVWNSEVGSTSFGVATFLFDYACKNRTIWGGREYSEIRLRHSVAAPGRWIEEVAPAIQRYASSSTASVVKAIEDARSKKIDDVDTFLRNRFTTAQANAIKAAHLSDEQRPIETLWDAANGVTAYARGIGYQNERVALEREGGKILELAA